MNVHRIYLLAICILSGTVLAWGAAPYIGYVYPAGGQQGVVVRITVGGLNIRGVKGIDITGTGVRAAILGYEGAGGPLDRAQRDLLKQRIKELVEKLAPTPPQPKGAPAAPAAPTPAVPVNPATALATPAATPVSPSVTPATPAATLATPAAVAVKPEVTLPDLPDLRNLDQLTVKQLRKIADKYLNRQKRVKEPIAEDVFLEVSIAPDAQPGDRELRLITGAGLSNPLIFQVGNTLELREKDRDDDEATAPPPATAPVVLNGQIMPGEVTRFPLKLRDGQKLVITAQARHLIPYLADAVPGWFQAVLALYDAQGKEVAFADDNSFDPDPTLYYQVPQDGDYVLLIRDALYRGREDFVYRIAVREQTPGETPFPFANLGTASSDGLVGDANPWLPFVDSQLPQGDAITPNTTQQTAQKIGWPQLIKGCIAQPGESGFYQFAGKAGDTVVAEVYARRLGSPMDSLLRLRDATGHVLAWNDDYKDAEMPEMGFITHQADSYLSFKLPADGIYFVQVSDAQQHGGKEYNYYLRVGPPQADFVLRVTPSSVNRAAGGAAVLTVYAFRKDGWDGDIELTLKDAPDGFTLGNARIPAGLDHAKITLNVPRTRSDVPFSLHLEGHAVIGGKTITRPVVPADQKMQAFAYNHLVSAQELLVFVHK